VQEGDSGSVHNDSTHGTRRDARRFWSDHDDRHNPLLDTPNRGMSRLGDRAKRPGAVHRSGIVDAHLASTGPDRNMVKSIMTIGLQPLLGRPWL